MTGKETERDEGFEVGQYSTDRQRQELEAIDRLEKQPIPPSVLSNVPSPATETELEKQGTVNNNLQYRYSLYIT